MKDRSADWLRTAENDLAWGRDSLSHGYHAQCCYIAQQVGEKALKALALSRGFDRIRSHSIVRIAAELGINGEIDEIGRRLDQYYIPARYPDALPEGSPQDFFTAEQAREAIAQAATILGRVTTLISGKSADA